MQFGGLRIPAKGISSFEMSKNGLSLGFALLGVKKKHAVILKKVNELIRKVAPGANIIKLFWYVIYGFSY
jgi:hypothetical protein